jgi:predicted adenylyl cyclase CyaB
MIIPRNVEIKARISSVAELTKRVGPIATEGPIGIPQDDTFFACEAGRLKLRVLDGDRAELIFYSRSNDHGPTESTYVRAMTGDPETLRECLTRAYGQAGRVRKQRTLYLVGRSRIHLDKVHGLGEFLEIEVVLEEDEPIERGVSEAHALMERLGVRPDALLDQAYVDLVMQA